MEKAIKFLGNVIDIRQKRKVKHKMSEIIAIVFFAMLTKAESWYEIWLFECRCVDFL